MSSILSSLSSLEKTLQTVNDYSSVGHPIVSPKRTTKLQGATPSRTITCLSPTEGCFFFRRLVNDFRPIIGTLLGSPFVEDLERNLRMFSEGDRNILGRSVMAVLVYFRVA